MNIAKRCRFRERHDLNPGDVFRNNLVFFSDFQGAYDRRLSPSTRGISQNNIYRSFYYAFVLSSVIIFF